MNLKKIEKRTISLMLTAVICILSGCDMKKDEQIDIPKDEITDISVEEKTLEEEETSKEEPTVEITEFTMFVSMPGEEIYPDNDIREMIARKTGVRVMESWLPEKTTVQDAVAKLLESGELPDFIDGTDSMRELYEANVLVPWDDYLEKYPNLKELYTDEEWDLFRQDDGHIYWANPFCNIYGEDQTKRHNDEAFWIQVRVLEYFDYPEITTFDEYFDILEKYYEENKSFTNSKGEEVDIIPYTALCEDWRYFCIENAPNFLDGYMNDGTISVDTKNYDVPTVISYDNTPTAKRYLAQLNEAYNKGMMPEDFDAMTYDEYIELVKSGALLGMCDQFWDFGYALSENRSDDQKLCEKGCEYAPLGLTIDEDMSQCWYLSGESLNSYSGTAVTTSCEDPELAFSFLNSLLDQEIHDLRFWGVEGVDYLVDDDGLYYRTPEMREACLDEEYKKNHFCQYLYMPQWLGTSKDNINAMQPAEQDSEYLATLSDSLAECFEAYDVGGYVEMIGSEKVEIPIWFPLYTYSSGMAYSLGQQAYHDMVVCKHEWLPKVVKAKNFESAWNNYMKAYDACNPEDYISEMQEELDERIARYEN